MKISQLTPITKVRRDIKLPLSVAGQNGSMTVGQILDAASAGVIPFDSFFDSTPKSDDTIAYSPGAPGAETPGEIIFDSNQKRFYYKSTNTITVAGIPRHNHILYAQWDGSEQLTNSDGGVRTDCLFVSSDSRLYHFNGSDLLSAGLTQQQADQLTLNTPIEVESEEAMEQLIEADLVKPGQIYFIAEE